MQKVIFLLLTLSGIFHLSLAYGEDTTEAFFVNNAVIKAGKSERHALIQACQNGDGCIRRALGGHVIDSGPGFVVAVRKSERICQVSDSEKFEKITIELPSQLAKANGSSPGVRAIVSFGSSGWIPDGATCVGETNDVNLSLGNLSGARRHIAFSFKVTAYCPNMSGPMNKHFRYSMDFSEKRVDELSPWLGSDFSYAAWDEASFPKITNCSVR